MRNREAEFIHECPVRVMVWDPKEQEWETCDAEVRLHYDTGKSPDDFQLQEDSQDVYCARLHRLDSKVVEGWYDEDFREMGERMAEAHESAYWDHVNSLIDKRLGK